MWHNMKDFQLIVEIGGAISLPDSKDYKIKVCLNDWSWETNKPIESARNYCRFNQRFEANDVKFPYKTNDNIGKVFVYLMNGKDPICFWKGSVLDFFDKDPKMQWFPFTNDMAVGDVDEAYKAGMV